VADNVKWYGQKVFTLATKANVKAMKIAATHVANDVKTHFTRQGSGSTVGGVWRPGVGRRRTKDGKIHLASRPGQPPAIDTGVLRASIMSDVQVRGMNVIGKVGPDVEKIAAKADVGTDVEYGLYLELGTSKMAPRPFLRPSLRRTRRDVKRIFKRANS
jgi:HK97 gp10 family phage protein